MKPVDQTRYGVDANGKVFGNCFAACIASLLECSLEEADCCSCDDDAWWHKAVDFLRARGLFMLDFALTWNGGCPFPFCAIPTGALCIISGPSPRFAGATHACIGRAVLTFDDGDPEKRRLRFELAHDPHPSHEGFAGDPTALVFLVPFNPAEKRAA